MFRSAFNGRAEGRAPARIAFGWPDL